MSGVRPSAWTSPAWSPFEEGHADPWASTFIDVPELNGRVSQAIAGRIAATRDAARRGVPPRTSGLLLLGPAGAGKTHLFVRLRRTLGPRAAFVHLRPLVGTEMTPRYVLGQIVQQLAYEAAAPSEPGYKQLDALVGSSLAVLEGEPPDYPRAFLDELHAAGDDKRRERIERAVETLLARHREADERYLVRLLEAPFMKPAEQRAALAWLAGRELEEAQAKRLGVSFGLAEDRVLQALQTLGLFAARGAPVVLVFDQLENLVDGDITAARVRSYGNLIAELTDTTRGYVLVQMALDSEWERAIYPQLSLAQQTRVGETVDILDLPSAAHRRELVRRWVEALPNRSQPFPWPFGERRVARWCDAPGMTPRMLMIACRQALAADPGGLLEGEADEAPLTPERSGLECTEPRTPEGNGLKPTRGASAPPGAGDDVARADSLAVAWEKHLTLARRALDEAGEDRRSADAARLVGGMACAMRLAPGTSVSRVDARQPVQIVVRAGGESHAVVLVHQNHPRSVTTVLQHAAECLRSGRVLIVRERALEFPPTWKKAQALQGDLARKGARWLLLERDDAARLLALESFLAAARSRDLEDRSGRPIEERDVCAWVVGVLGLGRWPLIRALSSRQADSDAESVVASKTLGTSNAPAVSKPAGTAPAVSKAAGASTAPTVSKAAAASNAAVASKTSGASNASVASKPPMTSRAPVASRASGSNVLAADTAATTLACLAHLRIASLERLVREVARVDPCATRSDVLTALQTMGGRVRWFGRSIVAVQSKT
jgi:hypothetical protein